MKRFPLFIIPLVMAAGIGVYAYQVNGSKCMFSSASNSWCATQQINAANVSQAQCPMNSGASMDDGCCESSGIQTAIYREGSVAEFAVEGGQCPFAGSCDSPHAAAGQCPYLQKTGAQSAGRTASQPVELLVNADQTSSLAPVETLTDHPAEIVSALK
ncbi:MAG: hypothetical protein GC154_00180 [bacterium]|nr:hypothetical protein [bacterium]